MSVKKQMPILIIVCMLIFSCFSFCSARESKTVTIPISHKVIGLDTSETFHFIMERDSEEFPLPKETTKSIKGNGEESFEVQIDDVGRFDYTIREVEGGNKETKYDTKIYKVIIAATFNENNDIVTSVILEDGTKLKPEKVEFVDTSNAITTVKPIVRKVIKGSNKDYKDKFTFKLEGDNVSTTTSIKGEGKTAFKELKFDKPGEYTYSVYEVKNKKSDWDYDDKKYEYVVTVTEKDGTLTAKSNYAEMKFKNTPTLLKKTKRLANIISGGSNSKTGDSNNYLRYACIVALIALIALIVIGRMKKVK